MLGDKFWSKVDKSGSCWLWTGHKTPLGYGRYSLNGKQYFAHRLALEASLGHPLGELSACHRCDVPSCVNPDHLWAGTHGENMIDCTAKGRRAKGERSGAAKLTTADIIKIRAAVSTGRCPLCRATTGRPPGVQSALAKEYGVTRQAISLIVRGDTWGHVAS